MPLPTTFAGVSARGEGLFAYAPSAVIGSVVYGALTTGTFTWTCPAGVTSVSVIAVGGGGGNYSLYSGGQSYFDSTAVCLAPASTLTSGGVGTASYYGGSSPSGSLNVPGGGGAAGYSSNGGNGGAIGGTSPTSSSSGGGGGGSGDVKTAVYTTDDYYYASSGGGGVDLYGVNNGYSGSAGTNGLLTGGSPPPTITASTGGGNGGAPGTVGGTYAGGNSFANDGATGGKDSLGYGVPGVGGTGVVTYSGRTRRNSMLGGAGGGGSYGGGGGMAGTGVGYNTGGNLSYLNNYAVSPGSTYTVVVGAGSLGASAQDGRGAGGAIRIVWPGLTRSFPSTNVSTYTNENYY